MSRGAVATAMLLALFLVGILLTGYAVLDSGNAREQKTRAHSSSDLKFMVGGGEIKHNSILIDKYENDRVVLSIRQPIAEAELFRYLKFDLSPVEPGEGVSQFFWRRPGGNEIDTHLLEDNPLDIVDLQRLEGWEGAISEYGFIFQDASKRPLELSGISFEPATVKNNLLSLFSDWLQFEIWQQHSVNYLKPKLAGNHLPLVWIVALWAGLATIFYLTLSWLKKHPVEPLGIIVILLTGWILLDMRWIYNLARQANITQQNYWGKSEEQKYRAGLDGSYYAYAERLKKQVLPGEISNIFILNDDPAGRSYRRGKLQYFLAPHKVFNHDRNPRMDYARAGGYLLLLIPASGITFDPDRQLLMWNGSSLAADLVDRDPLGYLFRLHDIIPHESKLMRNPSD